MADCARRLASASTAKRPGAARFAWQARAELVAARGRVHKLTLFTHNFMDACSLDRERIDACVFMAITQDGPLSMCAYKRAARQVPAAAVEDGGR